MQRDMKITLNSFTKCHFKKIIFCVSQCLSHRAIYVHICYAYLIKESITAKAQFVKHATFLRDTSYMTTGEGARGCHV